MNVFKRLGILFCAAACIVISPALHAAPYEANAPKTTENRGNERPYTFELETGVGYDDNAYLSPAAPYTDFAVSSTPTVTPDVQSGFYVPLRFKAAYEGDLASRTRFLAAYRFSNDMYWQTGTDNADRYTHRLDAGLKFVLNREKRREDTLAVAPFAGLHRQIYVDHDTGLDKTSGVNVISNRYNYRSTGLDAAYRNRTSAVPFEVRAFLEHRDYEDPPGITTELDNTYASIGAGAELRLTSQVRMEFNYDYARRDYSARKALDQNGSLVDGTTREYAYHKVNASIRNRLTQDLVLYLDYFRTIRNDLYVGYNDYLENRYRLRAIYDAGAALRLRAELSLGEVDYDRAFAFENPTQPRKTLDRRDVRLAGEYRLGKPWSLETEYRARRQDSTDLRYAYDRDTLSTVVKWEY
jgi:hypothetical protein